MTISQLSHCRELDQIKSVLRSHGLLSWNTILKLDLVFYVNASFSYLHSSWFSADCLTVWLFKELILSYFPKYLLMKLYGFYLLMDHRCLYWKIRYFNFNNLSKIEMHFKGIESFHYCKRETYPKYTNYSKSAHSMF